jgi:hypothetical protein
VLLDPDDDVNVTTWLLRWHDPGTGVIVVHPTPSGGTASLAHDVLAALGRPIDRLDPEGLGSSEPAWRSAEAWLAADRPVVILLRAHTLTERSLHLLLTATSRAGSQLLVVCHRQHLTLGLRRTLDGTDYAVLPGLGAVAAAYGLGRVWRRGPQDDGTPPGVSHKRWPSGQVPLAHLHVYRAEAYRRLTPQQFAVLDSHYRHGMDTAMTRLGEACAADDDDQAAEARLGRFLTAATWDSTCRPHTYARIRGLQAGFAWRGYRLTVGPPLVKLGGPGLTSIPFTADVAARIRACITSPVLAAAVAIACVTGIDAPARRYLDRQAISPFADVLTLRFHNPKGPVTDNVRCRMLGGEDYLATFHVPPLARPFLIAARAFLYEHRQHSAPAKIDSKLPEALQRCGLHRPVRPYQPATASHRIAGTWQLHAGASPVRAPYPGLPLDPDVPARPPWSGDVDEPPRYDPHYQGPASQAGLMPWSLDAGYDQIAAYLAAGHVPHPVPGPDLQDLMFALRLTPHPCRQPWIPGNQRRRAHLDSPAPLPPRGPQH